MNGLWSAVAAGTVAALLSMLLKEAGGKYATAVCLVAGVLLVGWFVSRLSPTLAVFGQLMRQGPLAPYAEPVLKALGIGYVVELGGGVCRDVGAEGVAQKLELCGKAELLAVGLPLLSRLLSLTLALVEGV